MEDLVTDHFQEASAISNRSVGPPPAASARAGAAVCRGCGAALQHLVLDLGLSPLANDYLALADLGHFEKRYPLRVYLCEQCLLVQLEEFEPPQQIFREDYAYFSSYSESWVRHARDYVEMMVARFGYGRHSQVIEIASNDGYLLQHFHALGVPVLGVEPAVHAARVAEAKGIRSVPRFFGTNLAHEMIAAGTAADLLIGNNVLAHVPDVHDFVRGLRIVLKPGGVLTLEFPHFLELFEHNEFDTIYHEHFSYFSFLSVQRIFAAEGLVVFDVEMLRTHGGSLRVFCRHAGEGGEPSPRVRELEAREHQARLENRETYDSFWNRVERTREEFVGLLRKLRANGSTVAAYGAPAKGNTLLNYCQIGTALISFTVDRNPFKQGHFLPGSRIPVLHPDAIREARPDFVLILPWNLKDEIIQQIGYIREWGGQFIVPIPAPTIIP